MTSQFLRWQNGWRYLSAILSLRLTWPRKRKGCFIATSLTMCFVLQLTVGVADEPAAPPSSQTSQELPDSLKRFKQIYLYQSQLAELLPPSYRAIDMVDLDKRLQEVRIQSPSVAESPQLIRSIYVARLVNDHFVSTRSVWDVSYQGTQPSRLVLGELGFALKTADREEGSGAMAKLSSGLDGKLSMLVEGDSSVVFAWTAVGKSIERGQLFDLRIPRSVQTRFLIELPRELELQAVDGVAQSLPSPPPEAGTTSIASTPYGGATQWYSIDAGGLEQVRIRILTETRKETQPVLPIRQASIQYDLKPRSIRFTLKMAVDVATGSSVPLFTIVDGQVTSVRVGGSAIPWSEVTLPEGVAIRIESSRNEPSNATGTVSLTIDGEAAWDSSDVSTQPVPWIAWRDCRPILIATELQTQFRLDPSLNAFRIQLPQGWRFSPTATAEDGSRLYRCGGAFTTQSPRVLVQPKDVVSNADALLRLTASDSQFQAQLDALILMDRAGPQPIELQIDPDWTVDLVTIPTSGRVVDLASEPTQRRRITIWPTSDEVVDGSLHVRVSGSQPSRNRDDQLEFPATSFVTIGNCRNRSVAMVSPPSGFNWVGDVALRARRIKVDELTDFQRRILGDTIGTGLLIELNEGRTAPLVCQRPEIAFDTTTRLALRSEGDQLVETCLIACNSTSTAVQTIIIDLGNAYDRPPMQWSAIEADGHARRIVSSVRLSREEIAAREVNRSSDKDSAVPPGRESAVETSPPATEIWQLQLADTGQRDVMLIGRREYPITTSQSIALPNVPGAAAQTTQVVLMPSLAIERHDDTVLKVHPHSSQKSQIAKFGAVAAETDPTKGSIVLQYDTFDRGYIKVARAKIGAPPSFVWREEVRVVASNRGGDTIMASHDVEAGSSLVLRHDANLQLLRVTDSGGATLTFVDDPTVLIVSVPQTVSRVITYWTRSVYSSSITRRWTPPRLTADGEVLQRHWKVIAASDTFIPSSPLLGERSLIMSPLTSLSAAGQVATSPVDVASDWLEGSGPAVRIDPADGRIWLVDSGMGYGLVSISGLICLAIGWWTSLRAPFIAAMVWVISIAPAMFAWDTSSLWISAICAPLACGSLIAVSIRKSHTRVTDLFRSRSAPVAGTSPNARSQKEQGTKQFLGSDQEGGDIRHGSSREHAISWRSPIPCWLFLALSVGYHAFAANGATGQEAAPPVDPSSTRPREVVGNKFHGGVTDAESKNLPFLLIPTGLDGRVAGSKVYLPQSFYQDLFRDRASSVGTLQVLSAAYRIRLEGTADSTVTADVEARYSVEDSTIRKEVRLPFVASQLRSIQWISEGGSRPLQWSSDGDSKIRVTLPSGMNASLLVRASAPVQSPTRAVRRLQFAIAPVASASLVVDSAFPVQRIEIAKSLGEVEKQSDSGRLTASIGAVDQIDLTAILRDNTRQSASIAQRRYWIHAGYERTNIECEIEPSDLAIRKGGEFTLVVQDNRTPLMTCSDWEMQSLESLSSTRQTLKMRATRDNPGPIRLLWELDSVIAANEQADGLSSMIVPDVVMPSVSATPTAHIAIDAAVGLRLIPQTVGEPLISLGSVLSPRLDSSTQSLSPSQLPVTSDELSTNEPTPNALVKATTSPEAIDAFISSWKGFRGAATEVISSESPPVRFSLVGTESRAWKAEELHHLHVRPGELQLSFTATITPGESPIGPLRVVLPAGSDLRVLTVNDREMDAVPRRVGIRDEVSLPEPTNNEPFRVRAVIHLRASDTFSPPRIRVEPIINSGGTYTLSRDQSLSVIEIADSGLSESTDRVMTNAEQLVGGWVPCWTWRIDQPQRSAVVEGVNQAEPPGVFRIEPRDLVIEGQQKTTVQWEQARWTAETLVRLRGIDSQSAKSTAPFKTIDFINIEIPTDWCDDLSIEPAEAWSRQPSIDPTMQIIRLRPVQTLAPDGFTSLIIRGKRSVESNSRLEVPIVKVLGSGKRDIFITVPRQIDERLLNWQSSAAIIASLPTELQSRPVDVNARLAKKNRKELVFRSVGGNTSIRLEPSRSDAASPTVTLADYQVFVAGTGQSHLLCRWDLNPGRLSEVIIDLPASIEPINVLIDGEPAQWKRRENYIEVQLALSRLGQSIALLARLAEVTGYQPGEMPQFRSMPAQESWVSLFVPAGDRSILAASILDREDWKLSSSDVRLLAIAKSIQQVTEGSLERSADRSQEEIAHWLIPWRKRFQSLAIPLTAQFANGSESSISPSAAKGRSVESPWDAVDDRWNQFVLQAAGDSGTATEDPIDFAVPTDGWRLCSVVRAAGQPTAFPKIRVTYGASTLTLAIQVMVVVIVAFGLIVLLWRARQWITPLTSQPATWLLATGIASFAIAPIPVAFAICFVALTAPLLMIGDTAKKPHR